MLYQNWLQLLLVLFNSVQPPVHSNSHVASAGKRKLQALVYHLNDCDIATLADTAYQLLQIFYHALHKACKVDGDGLVADVGGNFGWFSIFSAMIGCK